MPARSLLPAATVTLFSVLALSACSAPQSRDGTQNRDGAHSLDEGQVGPPTAFRGLVPPNGSLARAHIYEAKPDGQPVRVYRVYTAAPGKARAEGAYWAPIAPTGTRAGYYRDYVICPEWNDLDRLRVCELKAGAVVALGPGAAAKCSDGTVLPASGAAQVLMIPKWDPQQKQYALPVENCADSTPTWAE